MAKGGRHEFILRCIDCKNENYITKKSKQLHPEKQEFVKFCANCNKQTMHKEKK